MLLLSALVREGCPECGGVLVGQVSLHRAPDRIYLAAAICQPSLLLAASENLRNVENLAF